MKAKNDAEIEFKKKASSCKKLIHELPLELDRVIGNSTKTNHSVSVNYGGAEGSSHGHSLYQTGIIAYPVGSIICIYNPKENRQVGFLSNSNHRPFNWVKFSLDGMFLAAGEGTTRQPEITVWQYNEDSDTYEEYCILRGHRLCVEAVCFSPNSKHLVSLGDKNDKGLFVWDLSTKKKLTINRLTKWVKDLAFEEEGKYFVTCGIDHLKYWYFDDNNEPIKTLAPAQTPPADNTQTYMMQNEPADLTKIDAKNFVGIVCRGPNVYTLSVDGKLCVFNENRKVEKWMNIKINRAFGLQIWEHQLLCNCSDGIVRVFHTDTLEHILTLPKPPTLGSANQTIGTKKVKSGGSKDAKYADCIAIDMDGHRERVISVYSDGMTLIWDLSTKEKIKVMRAFLCHKNTIHDMEILPSSTVEITKFATCSLDKTIRFWNFYDYSNPEIQKLVKRNIYCKELEKLIYATDDFTHFKVPEDEKDEIQLNDNTDPNLQLRCIKASPDGKHIACGDMTGRVLIYDTENSEEISSFKAHDHEVVCLTYSPFTDESDNYVLATGSRDRLIHIFSSEEGYNDVNSLEGHSSSIIALKFAFDPDETEESKRLKLLSCGADKTIIYRSVEDPTNIQIYHKEVIKNNKFASMDVQGRHVVAGLDKLVTVTDIATHTKTYEKKPEKIKSTGSQDFVKVLLDRSETFLISASTDKFFTVQDWLSGTLVTKGSCGELITSIQLSMDNRHLITTSSEGCIYFWKLNEQITRAMNQRLKEFGVILPTLTNPIMPLLNMPELVKKKHTIKQAVSPGKPSKTSQEEDASQGKVLFSGKSPGEILFMKNQQKMQLEKNQKQAPEEDMTKSQIRREETKDVMNMVGGVADEIENLFNTNNIKAMEEAKAQRSPQYQGNKIVKATEDEELLVVTGQVPEWAATNIGHQPSAQPDYGDKENEVAHEIELENAESSITLQPPTKNNFMVENSQVTDKDQPARSISKDEDDEAYDDNVDELQYRSLKANTPDHNVRNSYVYDDSDNTATKQATGKFYSENKEEEDELEFEQADQPQAYSQKDWRSPEPMSREQQEEFKTEQKEDKNLSSYHDRRNKGKIMRQDPPTHPEQQEDNNSSEIEDILINQNKKPPVRRAKEWNKKGSKRPYNKNFGTYLEKDSSPLDYSENMKNIEEGIISKDDLIDDMMDDGLEGVAQTPKPNTKYPVPARENQFGEASFGNQTRQYQNLKKGSEKDEKSVTKERSPDKYNIAPSPSISSDSKPNIKSRIPTIGKNASKERRMPNKQIRSFVEEHNEELEEIPVPHAQDDENVKEPTPKTSKFNNPHTLGIPQSFSKKEENLSVKNNYDLSTQPQVKSDTNSALNEEFLQKEDSVHMDGNNNLEVHSDTQNYPHGESVGDTQLFNIANESVAAQADPMTTAAVNASINTELGKINDSLQKLIQITGRKDAQNVKLMPEVTEGVNDSFNLWLSMMVNLKANSESAFNANIKF